MKNLFVTYPLENGKEIMLIPRVPIVERFTEGFLEPSKVVFYIPDDVDQQEVSHISQFWFYNLRFTYDTLKIAFKETASNDFMSMTRKNIEDSYESIFNSDIEFVVDPNSHYGYYSSFLGNKKISDPQVNKKYEITQNLFMNEYTSDENYVYYRSEMSFNDMLLPKDKFTKVVKNEH